MRIAVVGAGFSGAVVAQELARAGHHVHVFEARDHVAGNCHTYRDDRTGIMVQKYGAHIFHTENDRVWNYVRRFGEFVPYVHRVKATVRGQIYSLPINLHAINQFYRRDLSPDEARALVASRAVSSIENPQNFEEQALKFVGPDLYEAFFKGYTIKQWGRDPKEIPASVLKRLPVRFNYDDNYFSHPHQGIPRAGYTDVVSNMLDHPRVVVCLGAKQSDAIASRFDHVFYTGPVDAWFRHCCGRLAYRTLEFVADEIPAGVEDRQGCPVMNYCDEEIPHTRRLEYKHFTPWRPSETTVTFREYSREAEPLDEPYYPVRLALDKSALRQYEVRVGCENRVTFLGRLGTYRYLDMDQTIAEALAVSDKFLGRTSNG